MFSFACLESAIFYINSIYADVRLSSSSDGHVFTTSNRLEWEEWTYQLTKDNSVLVKSIQHGRFLTMKEDGSLTTSEDTNSEGVEWTMMKSTYRVDTSFTFESKDHKLLLACDNNGHLYGSDEKDSNLVKWDLEFDSGELLFVSHMLSHECMKCDPFGNLSMTHNRAGWEVWRFIELDNGNILISSWTHKTKYICCNYKGHVYTTEDRHDNSAIWSVQKQSCRNGLIIQSVEHKSFLSLTNQDLCTTKQDDFGEAHLWDLEPANSHVYFISSLFHDRRIGTSTDQPFSTTNRKEWEQWKINRICTNEMKYTIQSQAHENRYLGSRSDGSIYVSSVANDAEVWTLKTSHHGGFFITSVKHNQCLACNDSYDLYTSNERDGWESWTLEPCMPGTISKDQIVSLSIAGAVALGTAIAMPFAITGIISGLGFTSTGIAAGSTAATMMSAEAIAAGGGVAAGGTVATLQSIGAVGLGASLTSAAVATGAMIGAGGVAVTYVVTKEDLQNIGANDADNIYYISSLFHDRRIGTSTDQPFSTTNRKEWEQWKINRICTNEMKYTIQSQAHENRYLGSRSDGSIYVSSVANDAEVWTLKTSHHGGFFITSVKHNQCLACNDSYDLYTSNERDGWESWTLEPCIPSVFENRPFCEWRSW